MKFKKRAFLCGTIILFLFYACTKNATPPPPVHDTLTVTKIDTLLIPVKPDTPNLKTGLLLYLPFNGSMADSSGNNNVTAVSGGASLTYDAHGYANSAFTGAGAGQRLIVTNNGSIKFDSALTLSYDVMLNSFLLQDLVTMVNTSNGEGVSFGSGLGIGSTNQYDFAVTNAGTDCSAIISPFNAVIDTTSFVLQPKSWYNVISIFNRGTITLYINGKLISTTAAVTKTIPVCPAASVIIGGWWDGGGATINGSMDEVRLYNRALASNEIAWLSRNFQPSSVKISPTIKTR